jgi:signal transduction histidine kinase
MMILIRARRQWIAWLLGAHGVIGALTLGAVVQHINQPIPGLLAYRDLATDTWTVGSATPDWWPALISLGMQRYDQLVSLDGKPWEQASAVIADAATRGEDGVTVRYQRPGENETRTARLPVTRYDWRAFSDHMTLRIAEGLAAWLLAIAVYRAGPNETGNRALAVAFSFFSLVGLTGQQGIGEWPWRGLTIIVTLLWAAQTSLIGAAVTNFGVVFVLRKVTLPRRRRLLRAVQAAVWGVSVVIAIGHAVSLALWLRTGADTPRVIAHAFFRADVVSILLGITLMVLLLMLGFWWRRHEPVARLQLRAFALIGLGTVAPALAIGALTNLIASQYSQTSIGGFNARVFCALATAGVAYVALRYQSISGARDAITNIMVYVIALTITSIVVWLMRATGAVDAAQRPPLEFVLLAALASGYFWRSQNAVRGLLGRLARHREFNADAVRQLGFRLAEAADESAPDRRVPALVCEVFELSAAALWLYDTTSNTYRLAAQHGIGKPAAARLPGTLPALEYARDLVMRWQAPADAPFGPPDAARAFSVLIPLVLHNNTVGLLALGSRRDEEGFDLRDLEVLRFAAIIVAFFLTVNRQIAALRNVPLRISEAQERERHQIALELHDDLQQVLGGLVFHLTTARNWVAQNKLDLALDKLDTTLPVVQSAAANLRRIVNNIAPGDFEKGLTIALQTLIDRARRTGLRTESLVPDEWNEYFDAETRQQLYRVVQQALDNIVTHAQAESFAVAFSLDATHATITITDDGCGFDEARRQEAAERGHLGLRTMRDRMRLIGGDVIVTSAAGAGTAVEARVPVSRIRSTRGKRGASPQE